MIVTVLTWFEWDSKLGISDIISSIAAVLTLVAVVFSAVASNSAKESARIARESTQYTKKQTELMENDLINTHLPKIIPVPQNIHMPVSKIHTSLPSNDIGVTTKFEIDVTNVSQGNAYMLSAWLEISNKDLLEHFNDSHSPKSYNDLHQEGYKLRVYVNTPIYKSIFTTLIMNDDAITEVWQSPIRQKGYPISSILKQDEKHKILIPNYVAKIILDSLYKSIELPSSRKDSIIINEVGNLFIKYKTGNQLETSDYTLRIYKLSITNIFITEPIKSEYGIIDEQEFIFSIDFLFVNEV